MYIHVCILFISILKLLLLDKKLYTAVYFIIVVVLLSIQVVSTVSLVSDGYLPEDGSGHVIAIQHLPDLDSVCVVTDKGDVILWNTVMDQARAFYV